VFFIGWLLDRCVVAVCIISDVLFFGWFAGHKLLHQQSDVPIDGWSIECRVYAEVNKICVLMACFHSSLHSVMYHVVNIKWFHCFFKSRIDSFCHDFFLTLIVVKVNWLTQTGIRSNSSTLQFSEWMKEGSLLLWRLGDDFVACWGEMMQYVELASFLSLTVILTMLQLHGLCIATDVTH